MDDAQVERARAPASSAFPAAGPLSAERLKDLHRDLLLPRLVEEKMLVLLRQGKLSKWFSGMGQEAIAVGVARALRPDDWILPMHRNLGVFTVRGVDLVTLFRQLFGKDGGFTKGRDRSFHFGVLEKKIVGMISHLGAMLPVADGLALAAQLKGTRQVAATFTGDGATSEGDFHEAVNLAAVWRLPVLFVIENNQYGLSTPVSEQYACRELADKGLGYGVPGVVVDGNDLLAVLRSVERAAGPGAAGRRADAPRVQDLPHARARGGLRDRLRAQAAPRRMGRQGPGGPLRGDAPRGPGDVRGGDAGRTVGAEVAGRRGGRRGPGHERARLDSGA
jgi:TPP-dependent pyruvate/acetoin dehydrogenase alpha subunit